MGQKVTDQVAEMRSLPAGIDQRSPARHPDWMGPDDFALKIQEIREATDGQIPIQLKLGAARVYDDVRMAAKTGPDSIYMDGMEGGCLIEGHLSHLLAPDAIVVLRCAPRRLQERLRERGYGAAKVTANVEWELLGGVHAELRDAGIDVPLLELDTSTTDANVLAERVLAWREGGFPRASDRFIDWLADPAHLPS